MVLCSLDNAISPCLDTEWSLAIALMLDLKLAVDERGVSLAGKEEWFTPK